MSFYNHFVFDHDHFKSVSSNGTGNQFSVVLPCSILSLLIARRYSRRQFLLARGCNRITSSVQLLWYDTIPYENFTIYHQLTPDLKLTSS